MDQELKNEFQALNQRFDAIISNMATKADIAELNEKIPSKEQIDKLYTVADKLAGEVKGYRENQNAMTYRVEQAETWIKKAAPKIGVEFQQ